MKNPLTPEELGALFQEIESEPTGKLSELAKVAGLNLAEDYVGVDLSEDDLSEDDLSGADFSFSNLRNVNLKDTNLTNSNLSGANLSRANLSGANLSGANLSGANLLLVQAIETDFTEANLTGACIEDWHINFRTSFENVKCDYIFLRTIGNKEEKFIFKERRPLKENTYFQPGDFEKLIRKSYWESLVERLSDLLCVKEFFKQVSKDFQRWQWKYYLSFSLILIILVFPLAKIAVYEPGQHLKIGDLSSASRKVQVSLTLNNITLLYKNIGKKGLEVEKKGGKNASNTSTPTTVTSHSTELTSTSAKSLEAMNIVYELQDCQKSNVGSIGQTISCPLLITSQRENVEFSLYSNLGHTRSSRIFEAGKEYLATRVKLGTYSSKIRAKNNLITNVPIEATITFDNVPLQVNNIDGLQISSGLISSYYNDYINVEFRNISLSENQ